MTTAAWIAMLALSTYSLIATGQSVYSVDLASSLRDADRDGVIDARDLCENTPLGRDIDHNGCPIPYLEYFYFNFDVQFESGKFELKPKFHSHLEDLALFLKASPETIVLIEGHTDNLGTTLYNKILSEARAKSIANALISVFGINPQRIKTFGFGEDEPVSSNDTEIGRKKNRRVTGEIVIPTPYKQSSNKSVITIPFRANQYFSQSNYQSIIEELGIFLSQNTDNLVIIEGHTDTSGSNRLNADLSKDRANKIANALVAKFLITNNRIKVLGHGGSVPIASNDTEEGREKNRRVEITTATRFKGHKEISLPKWTIWNVEPN